MHDLHVWSFGAERIALTVHLVADNVKAAVRAAQAIANSHGIKHSTIQAEHCGSDDVAACFTHNEHVDGCELQLLVRPRDSIADAAGAADASGPGTRSRTPASVSGASEQSQTHAPPPSQHQAQQLVQLRMARPGANMRHEDGCGDLVSPPPLPLSTCPDGECCEMAAVSAVVPEVVATDRAAVTGGGVGASVGDEGAAAPRAEFHPVLMSEDQL